jgi:hypothetical protein
MAMIRLLKQDDDSWTVSRFIREHNHKLAHTHGERRQWKSHSRIDQMSRDLVMHLRNNNVQISRVCSIVGSLHGTLVIYHLADVLSVVSAAGLLRSQLSMIC